MRKTMLSIVVILLAGAAIWGMVAGRLNQSEKAESEAPVQAPSRVSSENGKTVLSFDAAAQSANGIATTVLAGEKHNIEAQANGIVLELQPLLDLKTSYNTASADLAKARAALHASQTEYKRLQQLNQEGRNASDKAVEAARAASESDAAAAQSAEQSLANLSYSARLRWGPVVSNWMEQDTPQLGALLAQRRFLLQVTAVNPSTQMSPRQAIVQYADGTQSPARWISMLPQIDPRLQAPSFLYIAPAHPGLVPGMNLPVFLPSGRAQNGVVVPHDAVVWWQGNAWCYVEESPGKFTRQEVQTSNPLTTGWFVTEGIVPRTRVVTSGAQTLLSEEFRSEIQDQE